MADSGNVARSRRGSRADAAVSDGAAGAPGGRRLPKPTGVPGTTSPVFASFPVAAWTRDGVARRRSPPPRAFDRLLPDMASRARRPTALCRRDGGRDRVRPQKQASCLSGESAPAQARKVRSRGGLPPGVGESADAGVLCCTTGCPGKGWGIQAGIPEPGKPHCDLPGAVGIPLPGRRSGRPRRVRVRDARGRSLFAPPSARPSGRDHGEPGAPVTGRVGVELFRPRRLFRPAGGSSPPAGCSPGVGLPLPITGVAAIGGDCGAPGAPCRRRHLPAVGNLPVCGRGLPRALPGPSSPSRSPRATAGAERRHRCAPHRRTWGRRTPAAFLDPAGAHMPACRIFRRTGARGASARSAGAPVGGRSAAPVPSRSSRRYRRSPRWHHTPGTRQR
jgi:hypothetical protein